MRSYNPADAAIGDTLYLATPYGWSDYAISEWTVVRKTASGQIVCRKGEQEKRLNARGRILGGDRWGRESFVSPQHAAELRAQFANHKRWREIADLADELAKAARAQNQDEAERLLAGIASGIEARSDETPKAAQPEGREPDPKGDAQRTPEG